MSPSSGASLAALKLPFFATDGAQQVPANCRSADVSASDKRLVISNWPGYIDPKKKSTSTFQVFEDRTGITVDYTDDVNDNAEFYAKVKNQLGACETIGRDMIILTDWMAARMIGLGWIQPLDKAKVPNLHDNLIEPLRNRQWDPDLKFHAPWQTGLTGIAYNAAKTGEVKSFDELISRSDLKGRITLLSEMRDTMGFMLKVVGADPSKFTPAQWGNAIDRLQEVVSARAGPGLHRQRVHPGPRGGEHRGLRGVVRRRRSSSSSTTRTSSSSTPEEGLSLWSDNMLVPNHATHQANAEEWINYYYEPEVAAKLAAWVNYICPVEGARQAMEKIDPSLVDNQLIFPDEKTLSVAFDFMPLDDRQTVEYERDFSDVTGG